MKKIFATGTAWANRPGPINGRVPTKEVESRSPEAFGLTDPTEEV